MINDNSDRARRAERAVIAYDGNDKQWMADAQEQAYQVIQDFLCDLMHLCDRVGVELTAVVGSATYHYEAELVEEEAGDWPVFVKA